MGLLFRFTPDAVSFFFGKRKTRAFQVFTVDFNTSAGSRRHNADIAQLQSDHAHGVHP